MHVFVEPEVPTVEGDRRIDVVDDVSDLGCCQKVNPPSV
jgi:hypothetical protein